MPDIEVRSSVNNCFPSEARAAIAGPKADAFGSFPVDGDYFISSCSTLSQNETGEKLVLSSHTYHAGQIKLEILAMSRPVGEVN